MPSMRQGLQNEKFTELLDNFDLRTSRGPITATEGNKLFTALYLYFNPPTVRTDREVLQDALDTLQEFLAGLNQGQEVDVKAAMLAIGLDPSIRADALAVRRFMNENNLLTFHPRQGETWVKRLPASPTPPPAPTEEPVAAPAELSDAAE